MNKSCNYLISMILCTFTLPMVSEARQAKTLDIDERFRTENFYQTEEEFLFRQSTKNVSNRDWAGCVSDPLPSNPRDPHFDVSVSRYDGTYDLVLWREPCADNPQQAATLIKVTPTNEHPFLCSSQFTVVQKGIQFDSVKLKTHVDSSSFCDDVFVPITFLMDQWSHEPNFVSDGAFTLFLDSGSTTYNLDIPKYSPPGSTPPDRFNISGNVYTEGSKIPICGLVLANGKQMFSCDGLGSYLLEDVPLDSNGNIRLFSWANGFMPYSIDFTPSNPTEHIEVEMVRPPVCPL